MCGQSVTTGQAWVLQNLNRVARDVSHTPGGFFTTTNLQLTLHLFYEQPELIRNHDAVILLPEP
jgi:hypothetical protein